MIVFLLVLETVLAVAAQLFLRSGAARLADTALSPSLMLEPVRNPYIFSGLALQGVAFFLYVFVLSKVRLNVLYPVANGLSIVLITVASVVLFGERLGPAQLCGILAIAGGIGLVFAS